MPTKAQERYVWDTLVNGGSRNICELAGPLVPSDLLMNEDMLKCIFQNPDFHLFLNSIPAELGVGDVSSNLRFKHDKMINNDVIKNTVTFLEFYRINIFSLPAYRCSCELIIVLLFAAYTFFGRLLRMGLVLPLNN